LSDRSRFVGRAAPLPSPRRWRQERQHRVERRDAARAQGGVELREQRHDHPLRRGQRPDLVAARGVTDAFHALIRSRDATGLDAWIETALASPLESFAKGVAADRAAIAAAIETPWSNGQTEGQICRLKTLKRQMGGRANVDLLKERMLPAA
jgi:transposase